MQEPKRNILCLQNKMIPLRYHNAPLRRKATCHVAHCVGQWSVFFLLCGLSITGCRNKLPVTVGVLPSVFKIGYPGAFPDIKIWSEFAYFGKNVFIKPFFHYGSDATPVCVYILDEVFLVKTETHSPENQVKKLERAMKLGINFYDLIATDCHAVSLESFLIVKAQYELLEYGHLRASGGNVIKIKPDESFFNRPIAILQAKGVFDKFVIENGKCILFMLFGQARWLVFVVTEEYTDFYISAFKLFKQKINNLRISIEFKAVYISPFDFLANAVFFQYGIKFLGKGLIVMTLYKYSSVEVGVIGAFLVAFIKPNIYHVQSLVRFKNRGWSNRPLSIMQI